MLGLSSDLMKFTVVNESLSIYKPNVLYWELFNCFKDIIIKPTDKGSAVVIWNKQSYIDEGQITQHTCNYLTTEIDMTQQFDLLMQNP